MNYLVRIKFTDGYDYAAFTTLGEAELFIQSSSEKPGCEQAILLQTLTV